ncbi:alpha-amylase family glycosyl hydrolase [Psychrobacillus psychrodurans]|uniref:alpha-amylase family glycosyl hydrolase n=1 Tax=Psychrobacillus psychrodurans TaxID=126157 RepID=UPI0008EA8B3F|nr:alpha-amylase family glycosyl hydrolase [Psychrobacillus psychrodurans]MCZ8539862.1 alpha-amylase family glycosyl hydrolase [Psychrobacillus psychrodurans]SFM55582.1 alpha-amylase [Psychrobacillus psychrodurans]
MKKMAMVFILIILVIASLSTQTALASEERKMQDEIIYMIMVDRFNNGDTSNDRDANLSDPLAYHGGDFKGITEKLDYIKEMGFTAIWLTPIFENMDKGYHGYWIKDFYQTNEYFGSMEEFKTLVKEAHKRDIKVILDFVVNHVGPNHDWLNEPVKRDWFHENKSISNWNDPLEVETGWLYDLPDLDQDNPEVSKYLVDAAKWWIQETNIDGYRLDTVKHVPKEFWTDFSAGVKSVKESFFLIGEVWHDNPNVIVSYQDTGIDGFMDFSQNGSLRTAFEKSNESLGWLFSNNERNNKLFKRPELLGQFIDNHDMQRFTNLAVLNNQDPITQLKLGLTYMYAAPGIPIIYYGTETALDGGNDPDNRRMMDFNADDNFTEYIKKLAAVRQQKLPLTRGDMELLVDDTGLAIYKRSHADETLIVAINNTSESQSVVLEDEIESGMDLQGLIGGGVVKSGNNGYAIHLDSGQSEIYELVDRDKANRLSLGFLIGIIILLLLVLFNRLVRSKRNKYK